jgi:hypothetical protein
VEVCMKVLLNITCVTDKFARIEVLNPSSLCTYR